MTTEDIVRRLIAACSANPGAVGELLLATEIFQQGIAATVMVALMAFDKTLQRHGPQPAHQALDVSPESDEKVQSAFQVVDAHTAALAFSGQDRPLLILDLSERTISASDDLQVEASGEILAFSGDRLTDRAITYVLPREWTIHSLP